MNSKIRVSIIIPIYNVASYLQKCLDSFLHCLSDDFEVILVNDGSTDESHKICLEYYALYPQIIRVINKKNGGLSDARNVGVELAQGEYVYFLDSDDWIVADAIEVMYSFAKTNNCEIVQGGFYYAYDNYLLCEKHYIEGSDHYIILNRHDAMKELLHDRIIHDFAWGKLYRSDIVKLCKFPKGKIFEDSYWQHLMIHNAVRYGIVLKPLYYYRQRTNGISGQFSIRHLDLLLGYRERLSFIHNYYPQLEGTMSKAYRDLCIKTQN